jgi:hypothetical protein
MDNSEEYLGVPEETTKITNKFAIGMTAVLTALGVILALVALDVALISGTQTAQARPAKQVVKISGMPVVQATVYLTVSPSVKPGSDGKLHDAFSVTNFYARAGQPVKLVINNTDTSAHSITSPGADVSLMVKPGLHSYTLLVRKAGRFVWFCNMGCDPFSMSHFGYMRGYITVS